MKKGRGGEGEKGRGRDTGTRGRRDTAQKTILWLLCSLSLLLSFSPFLRVPASPPLPFSPSPLLPFSAAAHKYHFSFTQIEYNAKEKTAEITLRVFADDLEAAISKQSGKSIKLDHKEAAPIIAEYVRAKLELKGRAGRLRKLTWIGMEPKVDVALLYLAAKLPEGLAGVQLRQRVFFELFEDQVNQVLVKAGNNQAQVDFKAGDGFKALSLAPK